LAVQHITTVWCDTVLLIRWEHLFAVYQSWFAFAVMVLRVRRCVLAAPMGGIERKRSRQMHAQEGLDQLS
jgi:hypothetical protein